MPVAASADTLAVAAAVLGAAVAADVTAPPLDAAALPVSGPPRRARWLAPLAWSRIGIAVTGTLVAVREGVLTRELVAVPLVRVQSVRVIQGPLQRALDLATVHVDTAGGLHAVGRHRATADAYALADLIAARSRAARRAAAQPRVSLLKPSTVPQPPAAPPQPRVAPPPPPPRRRSRPARPPPAAAPAAAARRPAAAAARPAAARRPAAATRRPGLHSRAAA